MPVTFNVANGKDPARYIIDLAQQAAPTEGDVLFAAQRQRTRIIDRTYSGLDVFGNAFRPYDTTTPYYYYPNGRVGRGRTTAKQDKAAVARLLKKTAHITAIRSEHSGYTGVGGVKTRSGRGIRYESYADFKASLGRAGVDLTGPRAPHMLQAMGVRIGNQGFAAVGGDETNFISRSTPVSEFAIGIYGDAAGRATAHNTGYSKRWKGNHQRLFLAASATDIENIADDIAARRAARMTP